MDRGLKPFLVEKQPSSLFRMSAARTAASQAICMGACREAGWCKAFTYDFVRGSCTLGESYIAGGTAGERIGVWISGGNSYK